MASHSRKRAARSPEVGAENAPPVTLSRGWLVAADLAVSDGFTADSAGWDGVAGLRKENRDMTTEQQADGKTPAPTKREPEPYCRCL